MVKSIDHSARRQAVLNATIDRYIRNASAISSEDIAREFNLSSATIRNIFSELESEGYLTHPYTSGGRIPTSKGYRYYVDLLASRIDLLDEEKENIVRQYKREIKRLEDILENTSAVISTITNYAGIVSFLEWQDRFFYRGISLILDQPEFHDFEKMRLLIRLIEDKEKLMKLINRQMDRRMEVYIGEEMGLPEIDNCSLIISSYRIKDKPIGRVAILGPKRMEYRHAIPTLEYISDVLTDLLSNL